MNSNLIDLIRLQTLFDDLAINNWAIGQNIFSKSYCQALAHECQTRHQQGGFQKASIGSGIHKTENTEIRGDFTQWIEEDTASPLLILLRFQLKVLMEQLNLNFFMSLKHFETHFAVYPPKAQYQKHVDNLNGSGARQITFILYLNENWKKGDGGELTIYHATHENERVIQIEPSLGTFLLFRSDLFPHQVETNLKQRLSITGWLRNDNPILSNYRLKLF